MKRSILSEAIWNTVDLPNEVTGNMLLTEIFDNRRLLVENHKGILGYCPEKIIIGHTDGTVTVSGSDLHIAIMTNCRLCIVGDIQCVAFCGGKNEKR